MTDDEPDYYAILGVSINATQDEIKAAYRREARQWHPDKNPDDKAGAEQQFKLIGQAYEILSDPDQRHRYDTRPLRLVFSPSLIDFGDVQPGDPPKSVIVQLRNYGRPIQADDLSKYIEPTSGPFWSVTYAEEEPEPDPHLVYGFVFESEVDPDLPPERYSGTVRCFISGSFAELHIRANVLAGTTAGAFDDSEPWDTGYAPSAGPVSTGTPPRKHKVASLVAGGLAVILIAIIAIAVGVNTSGHHGSRSSSTGANSLLNLSSSQILAGNPSFLAPDGDIFTAGDSTLTLMHANGSIAWQENDSASDLKGGYDGPPTTQVSSRCAIATVTDGGINAEFISLRTGAQHTASGYGMMSGNRVAWSDGTIRDACTGNVLSRAAPNPPYDPVGLPECLIGSIVIANGGMSSQLAAWQAGHLLWRVSNEYDALCDSSGTTLLINGINRTVTRVNAATGHLYWRVSDPKCTDSTDESCISEKGFPGSVADIGKIILVSGADNVLAFDSGTGHLLWLKQEACMLAARSSPQPEALVGPCSGTYDNNNGTTAAVNATTGAVIKTWSIGNYNQWSANGSQMLAVDSNSGAARILHW